MGGEGLSKRWSRRVGGSPASQFRQGIETPGLRPGAPASAAEPPAVATPAVRPEPRPWFPMRPDHLLLQAPDQKLKEVDADWAVSDDAMRTSASGTASGRFWTMTTRPTRPATSGRRGSSTSTAKSRRGDYQVDNERPDFVVDAIALFPITPRALRPSAIKSWASALSSAPSRYRPDAVRRRARGPAGVTPPSLWPGWGTRSPPLTSTDIRRLDSGPSCQVCALHRRSAGMFLEVDQLEDQFDAVLFFESFHHCSDSIEPFSEAGRVISPGGRVFFAAEPDPTSRSPFRGACGSMESRCGRYGKTGGWS